MIPNWLGRNAGLNVGIVRLPFCTESSTFARCRAAHLERMRVVSVPENYRALGLLLHITSLPQTHNVQRGVGLTERD